ncbi:MAG: hypothetical protein J7K87_00575 [Candidatus Aenigmarchaeota archaeon]|nr:hypothetical protein [Candidatus Aenigmarchaeota archaeon]
MIKSRLYLGASLIVIGLILFWFFYSRNMINTFLAGSTTVTLIVLGFFYTFFAVETPEYLKKIQNKKKRK